MPPASLVRKVTEYELSGTKKSNTNKKKSKASASTKKRTAKAKPKKTKPSSKAKSTSKASSARSNAKTKKPTKSPARGTAKSTTTNGTPFLSSLRETETTRELHQRFQNLIQKCAESSPQTGLRPSQHTRVELSPNSRAKCRSCLQVIRTKQRRLAVCSRSNCRYYHTQCVPEGVRKTLPPYTRQQLPPIAFRPINSDLEHHQRIERDATMLFYRSALVGILKSKFSHFLSEKMIKDLVISLPSNEVEFSNVVGTTTSFGSAFSDSGKQNILQEIQKYVEQSRGSAAPTQNSRTRQPSNNPPEVIEIIDSDDEDDSNNNPAGVNTTTASASAQNKNSDSDDSDDDEIVCEETLTNAQVVQQKFDRAAANGEMIAID